MFQHLNIFSSKLLLLKLQTELNHHKNHNSLGYTRIYGIPINYCISLFPCFNNLNFILFVVDPINITKLELFWISCNYIFVIYSVYFVSYIRVCCTTHCNISFLLGYMNLVLNAYLNIHFDDFYFED